MLIKHFHKILLCLATLGITSLQAAHLLQQEDTKTSKVLQLIHKVTFEKDQKQAKVNLINFGIEMNNAIRPLLILKWRVDQIGKQIEAVKDKKILHSTISEYAHEIVKYRNYINMITKNDAKKQSMAAQAIIEDIKNKAEAFEQKTINIYNKMWDDNNALGTEYKEAAEQWQKEQATQIKLWCDASSMLKILADKLLEDALDKQFMALCLENFIEATGLKSLRAQDTTKLLLKNVTLQNHHQKLNEEYNQLDQKYHNLKQDHNKQQQELESLKRKNTNLQQLLKAAKKDNFEFKYKIKKVLKITRRQTSFFYQNDPENLCYNDTEKVAQIKNVITKEISAVLTYSPLKKGHTCGVESVAISSDNKYIVSGSGDHTIRIWDLKTGKELPYSPLKAHTWVQSVAITSDNKYIVRGGGAIAIWDMKTGKELPYSPLKGHTDYVNSVAITSDNKYIVSGSFDKTIRIWELATGREVKCSPLKSHTCRVNSVAITRDNKYIVSGSHDKTIRIWDFKTGQELSYSPLKGHTGWVYGVAISSDNKYIVSGSDDHTIRICDLKTGQEVSYSPLTGHTDSVYSVAITSDNRYIVSGSNDKTICIWDLKTGKEVYYSPLTGHTASVISVPLTSDNKYIVSGSNDKTIRIWDFELLSSIYEDAEKENDEKDNEVFDID